MPNVWIVEVDFDNEGVSWEPTVGIGLSREDGREKLAEWKSNNPDDRFRLVRYVRVKDGEEES